MTATKTEDKPATRATSTSTRKAPADQPSAAQVRAVKKRLRA